MNCNHRIKKYPVIILAVFICQFFFNSLAFSAKYNFLNENKITGKDYEFTISPLQWNSWNDDKLADKNLRLNYLKTIDYLKQKKIDKAKKSISNLLSQYPNETRYINLYAVLKILEKDIAAAKSQYQKTLKIESNNLTALLGLAKLALQEGEFEDAEHYAKKALLVDKRLLIAYFILAENAFKQRNFEGVESVLLRALSLVKGNLDSELQIVDVLRFFYQNQHQISKLLPINQEIVKRYPDDISARSSQVVTLIANNQTIVAEKALIQIINQDKQDISHRLLLAELLDNSSNQEDRVFTLLEEVLSIQADNLLALKHQVKLQIKLGQYQAAFKTVDKINNFYPQKGVADKLKGELYIAKKDFAKALMFYKLAYFKDKSIESLFETVDLLLMQNQQQQALELLNNEIETNRKNIAVHFKLAAIYQQTKNYHKAEIHYKNILLQQSNNLLALNNLAWVYSQQNKTEALDIAKKAYEIAPESTDIADTYAMILVKQGKQKLGLSIIEKAASMAQESKELQYHVALALSVNGKNAKAIKILQQIKNSGDDFSEKQEALDLLRKLKQN